MQEKKASIVTIMKVKNNKSTRKDNFPAENYQELGDALTWNPIIIDTWYYTWFPKSGSRSIYSNAVSTMCCIVHVHCRFSKRDLKVIFNVFHLSQTSFKILIIISIYEFGKWVHLGLMNIVKYTKLLLL